MPTGGEPLNAGDEDNSHIPALARAFGHYPIALGPERERELRAMAATWSTMENNPYYLIANMISNRGTIVLFLED